MSDETVTNSPEGRTTIIERRSGGGTGIILAVALLVAVAVGAYFLLNNSRNDNLKTDAVTTAAGSVGDAADRVGDTAKKAGDAVEQ